MGRFSLQIAEGFTRLCLDPWAKVFIRANGDVCLCCNAPSVGSIHDNNLKDILEGIEADKYRIGLLTGSPPYHCQTCPDRKIVPIDELVKKVNQFKEDNIMDVF